MDKRYESTSFDDYVREIEEDSEQKEALDYAREMLRRDLGEGEEESYVS